MITEKERQNREQLFRLMRENPDLPVLPMVETEVVAGDYYGYWAASFGNAEVKEYAVDEWRGDGLIVFRDDDEEKLIEDIAERKYNGTAADYERAEKEAETIWTKAIVVYMNVPN